MDLKEHILEIRALMRDQFLGEGTGHDWWHIQRVHDTALTIAKAENANLEIVSLAALLHDIADHKFHGGDEKKSGRVARDMLDERGISEGVIQHICTIIDEVSFKGAGVVTPMSTIEGACVQDADRLDAIGAIGIARAFAYGGSKGRSIYEPEKSPEMHDNFEAYKTSTGHTINHFYEKLLLLKDRMNTDTGKAMADDRHRFMESFLNQFFAEWKGER